MLFIFRCEDSDYFAITQIRWVFLRHLVGCFWGISLGVFGVKAEGGRDGLRMKCANQCTAEVVCFRFFSTFAKPTIS